MVRNYRDRGRDAASTTQVEVHDCHDVQKWIKDGQTGLFQPKMDCDWVAQDKEKRCKQWGEVIADEVCRASCGRGGGVEIFHTSAASTEYMSWPRRRRDPPPRKATADDLAGTAAA